MIIRDGLDKEIGRDVVILKKLYEFNVPVPDLVHIYILYVRSILEFNSCVWHFNITQGQGNDIDPE